jgi:hypothetical protein
LNPEVISIDHINAPALPTQSVFGRFPHSAGEAMETTAILALNPRNVEEIHQSRGGTTVTKMSSLTFSKGPVNMLGVCRGA